MSHFVSFFGKDNPCIYLVVRTIDKCDFTLYLEPTCVSFG